tara:strand:+ start:291 stop:419 length:129 start_codon:yes stop_codon:yes gene_type:complete
MKTIINIVKSKNFLIGVAVGVAGLYAYNKYAKKDTTTIKITN